MRSADAPAHPAPAPDTAAAAWDFAIPVVAPASSRPAARVELRPDSPGAAGTASAASPAFAADMLAAPGRTRLASEAAATWLNEGDPAPATAAFAGPERAGSGFAAGGSGTETRLLAAVPAAGPQSAALGDSQSAAYAWGYNYNGQLGNNSTTNSSVPVAVSSAIGFTNSGVSAIAAGYLHSLALQNGAVYAWGYNFYGQFGNNSTTSSTVPVAVSHSADGSFTNTGVTAIAAGYNDSLALQNGAVYAWGNNFYGQLGINSTTESNLPVAVNHSADGSFTNTGVTAIAAGYVFSLALQNGAVYAWGNNQQDQLGNPKGVESTVPVAVSHSADGSFTNTGVTAIAAGYSHSLAVQNGAVYAWGVNTSGQLGNNSTTNSKAPVAVLGLSTGVTCVAGGYAHSLAVQNGNVFAWGSDNDGQLGNGTTNTTANPTPAEVLLTNGTALSGIVQVAAGQYSSYALSSDGSLYAWGLNSSGQLGDGGTTEQNAPEHLLPPTGEFYQLISSNNGGTFALAILGDTPVPEPATWLAGALTLAAGTLTLRRRLRRA